MLLRMTDILIADDDTKVRAALRLLFEQQSGLRVAGEAVSGESVLASLIVDSPDLVLLDWELPGPAAPALVAGIRALCPNARVVAMSGRIEAYRAALAAGVDAFVSKGDPPERLLGTLHLLARGPVVGDPLGTLHFRSAEQNA